MLVVFLALLDDEKEKILFEDIYNSYRKQMVYVALSITKNPFEAEDVVQDVFFLIATKYMKKIQSINNEIDLRNYLLKATKNTAINFKKREKKTYVSLDTITEYDLNNKEIKDDEFIEYICDKIEYEKIVSAISSLSQIYRDVLYYHFVLELSVPQTAEFLHQSITTTKKQLVRGKKLLLDLLERGDME